MELLIKNVRRVTSAGEELCSVGVDGGRISAILPPDTSLTADRVVDGTGKYLLPGLIDLHVHFRDPGFEYKEDIISGSKCAAAGGVTSVFCMPNTKPVCDNPETLAYILDKAKSASCRVFQVAAITKGLESREVNNLPALKNSGASAFSDDGKPVMTSSMLRDAMKTAAENDLLIMSHCEEMTLAGGAMNEGETSRRLGLCGTPDICEDIATVRDILVAEDTGCRLHVCHVSTRGSLEAIRAAKKRGVKVTCETCPHYFILTDEDVPDFGANAKMNPPLRSKDDREAVIEAILDGTIDCISTDHAPHSEAEKALGLGKAPNGIIGLQTSFIAAYTALVATGKISLSRLVGLMSFNPAKITGLDQKGLGRLDIGSPADFALISTGVENTLKKEDLAGKSANTPFIGKTFSAAVEMTFVSGELKYERKN